MQLHQPFIMTYIRSLLVFVFLIKMADTSKCEMNMKTCEFWLEIDMKLTMMDGFDAVYPKNGKLYKYNVPESRIQESEAIDVDKVISTDGWETQRLVIVANGTIPGPALIMYLDQDIIVHVKNNMASETTTIHFHGLHQRGTPWMDGVAYISQCPIGPGETFTYKFKASPKGSFIYHAHVGAQRTMGLFGPFIVRDKKEPVYEERVAIISDWNHDWDSNVGYLKMIQGIYVNRRPYVTTKSLDGADFSRFRFDSGLINGRGRYYPDQSARHNGAPLEVFRVQKNKTYKFRWMAAGNMYPFRISVDNHPLTIIASDGYDLEPVTAESFIINPGERYDFTITTNKPVGNYWIRAVTLEVGVFHRTEAILRYKGAPEVDPNTRRDVCTTQKKCLVLNCPFRYYPKTTNTVCYTFDAFKAVKNDEPLTTSDEGEVEERFLNFAFPGMPGQPRPGSVNGREYQPPSMSAQTQSKQLGDNTCGSDCGEQKLCKCMHSLSLDDGKIYQLVLTNMGNGKGWGHPVHMHGHAFHVLKMGFSKFNINTGRILEENLDIDCRGGVARAQSYCNNPTWADPRKAGNNVPGMELEVPPRKDTIIVPSGGYVVVRIKADNPGVWFMHCHIELHNHNGMAMVLNESFSNHPKPPHKFPKCGDFKNSGSQINSLTTWMISGLILVQLF